MWPVLGMEEPWAGQDSGLIRVNLGHFHSLLNILGMISNKNENNKYGSPPW